MDQQHTIDGQAERPSLQGLLHLNAVRRVDEAALLNRIAEKLNRVHFDEVEKEMLYRLLAEGLHR